MGRRTAKIFDGKVTRWVWDGNTPVHEWKYNLTDRPKTVLDEFCMLAKDREEPIENLITWIFDEGTFKPTAKIIEDKTYSIVNDYLGTPCEAYDEAGERVWEAELDIYGKVRKSKGNIHFVPFRYQGQYEDKETGLYYNRFRYYSPEEGMYVSQDPIGLFGGKLNIYQYVKDVNFKLDILGLSDCVNLNVDTGTARAIIDGSSDEINALITGKNLHMTQTAIGELNEYAAKYGREADVANFLKTHNVSIIPDNPSARASALSTTRKVGDNDKIIFGIGDELGMPTITSDAKFLRGASAQGVDFDALVHSPI